jgi:hypothetical protein
MEEKAMSKLTPWECCPTVWKSEAAYFTWIRGQMRRAWSRHPVKIAYMQGHRGRYPIGKETKSNPEGMVWGCKCEICSWVKSQSECEVDHIQSAGSFRNWDEFSPWMQGLMLINFDDLQVVCKECHKIKSYADKWGMSFEEARLEKEVIVFTKLPAAKQVEVLRGITHRVCTTAKQRRAAYKEYLIERGAHEN